jgi:hypothetical protein
MIALKCLLEFNAILMVPWFVALFEMFIEFGNQIRLLNRILLSFNTKVGVICVKIVFLKCVFWINENFF